MEVHAGDDGIGLLHRASCLGRRRDPPAVAFLSGSPWPFPSQLSTPALLVRDGADVFFSPKDAPALLWWFRRTALSSGTSAHLSFSSVMAQCLLSFLQWKHAPRCRVERSLLWEITGSLAAAGNDLRVGN